MFKAYRYELRPTELQKQQLNGAFGSCRFIYNLALETKISSYQRGKNVSCFDLMKQMTQLKKDLVWLSETPTASLQHSISHLDNAYTNFFKGRASFPKFKSKSDKQSFKIPTPIKVDFDSWTVTLPKYKEISFNRDRIFKGSVRNATVNKTKTGRYFISIIVDSDNNVHKPKAVKAKTTVGIDLGLKHFIVLSDGTKVDNPKFLNRSLKELRIAKRSLARKVKGSNRRAIQKIKVAIIHERVTNQRKDFLHKLSTEIVNQYDSIAIENLNVAGMVKNRCLSRSISDAGWGMFTGFLAYKAEWYGKNILEIGRFEPSSKMCSCGKINNELKLSDREWTCVHCGTKHDRDILAANNIKNFGLRAKPNKRQREAIA